jgi:hypothetical protein
MRRASRGVFVLVVIAAYEVTSGWGVVVSILVLGLLFLAWVVALFLLVGDSIPVFAKIVWFVALTCLAPIAIPVYLVLRHRRLTHSSPEAAGART